MSTDTDPVFYFSCVNCVNFTSTDVPLGGTITGAVILAEPQDDQDLVFTLSNHQGTVGFSPNQVTVPKNSVQSNSFTLTVPTTYTHWDVPVHADCVGRDIHLNGCLTVHGVS